MIFHQHKCIFFHIGKTAGVSIEKWLDNNKYDVNVGNREIMFGWDKDQAVYLQHASVSLTRELVDPRIFEKYYKFSIVRNPYSRAISVYYYLYDKHQKQYGSFDNYIRALPQLLKSKHLYKGSHHIPQIFYTHSNQQCICDQIVKFEHLPQALDPIRQQLNLDTYLEHHNKIVHPKRPLMQPADIYSKEMIKIMQDIYRDDFENFNYSPFPQ